MKKRLARLSPESFQHPDDTKALKALKNTAGFDRLVRFIMGLGLEPVVDYQNRSNFVLCGENQCEPIHRLHREAAEILDIDPLPPLFLAHSPAVNAWTFGSERPYVVVTSALVEGFTDDEIQCVIGHELGHILAGHSLYRTVGAILLSLLRAALATGGGLVALPAWLLTRGLVSALFYWMRTAELTSDRAGLLVVQNPLVAYSTEMKLAGGPGAKIHDMLSVEAFLEQARSFETDPELNNRLLKFVLEDGRTHPFPVMRAREMERWVESGDYERILAGDYEPRPQAILAGQLEGRDELDGAVEDVIQTSLSRVFGVYTAPKISESVLERCTESFANTRDDEEIVAIYEDSHLGGSGLVLTTRRLYSAKRPNKGIAYEAIAGIRVTGSSLLRSPAICLELPEHSEELSLPFHRTETRDGLRDAIASARRVRLGPQTGA